jgi:hypothetical protein
MTPVSERKSETHELLPTAAAEAVTLPDWGPPFRLPSHHHQRLDRGRSARMLLAISAATRLKPPRGRAAKVAVAT